MKELSEMLLLSFLHEQIKEKTHCKIQSNESFSFEHLGIYFFSPQALSFNCQKSKGR